jgi:hypothetical protein
MAHDKGVVVTQTKSTSEAERLVIDLAAAAEEKSRSDPSDDRPAKIVELANKRVPQDSSYWLG